LANSNKLTLGLKEQKKLTKKVYTKVLQSTLCI